MRRLTTIALASLVLLACNNVLPPEMEARIVAEQQQREAYVQAVRQLWVLDTDRGTIVIRMFPDDAGQTVEQVRQWTRAGVYDGTWFHRVIREPRPFIVQGGDPSSAAVKPATDPGDRLAQALDFGHGTTDPELRIERTRRRHTPGAVALAVADNGLRAGPQFVIALADLPHLDGEEPVFGHIEGGWQVVQALQTGDRIRKARLVYPEDIPGDWYRDIPPGQQ